MFAVVAAVASAGVATPLGWVHHHSTFVPPTTPISFSICIKSANPMDHLFTAALEVSTPGLPRYGKFLTVEEIERLTAPSPADVNAVTAWLRSHDIGFTRNKECLLAEATVGKATDLLQTGFHLFRRKVDGRLKVLAGEYALPPHIDQAVEAIFGLHGVPLPPRVELPKRNPSDPEPANVTPTVLAQTYHVKDPYVKRGGKGKQAVAEFQGQYMSKADLKTFFAAEVPTALPGDEKVAAFRGVDYKEGAGVEALLDIEFIMGVAPGVHTEFWEWPDSDFCADLLNYTSTLLEPDGPLVNSISYGWQGDLAQVGCKAEMVGKVDANWAKLAAAGISMFISSGDSGSACGTSKCVESDFKKDKKISGGTVLTTLNQRLDECCEGAGRTNPEAVAFSWTPPPGEAQRRELRTHDEHLAIVEELRAEGAPPPPPPAPIPFKSAPYHVEFSMEKDAFPERDIHILDGIVHPTGGAVKVHNANGTFADTTMTFGAKFGPLGILYKQNVSMTVKLASGEKSFKGEATFFGPPLSQCEDIRWFKEGGQPIDAAVLRRGPNPPPPPPEGNCTLFSKMGTLVPASDKSVSGGKAITPETVTLYPSWPASSPWVTAVGATRFLNQTVGHEEMATDQFGSGGGFSKLWNQSHASWQSAAVAKYVAMGPTLPKWPPAGSFPPMGRATPDVSALGEGYQVYVNGKVQSVGGTSASSPAFAGYVSLLNEARFKAGKPQMGFFNPFAYANADAFTDVVKGTNAIGRGTGPLEYGFAAAPGWDAATGLGTPLFDKLLAAALEA